MAFEDYSFSGLAGVRPPREHQRLVRNLLSHLTQHLRRSRTYEPFAEVQYDDLDPRSLAPDLIIEAINGPPVLAIELTNNRGWKNTLEKCGGVWRTKNSSFRELFVFNYSSGDWCRLADSDFRATRFQSHSYSALLDADLAKFLAPANGLWK